MKNTRILFKTVYEEYRLRNWVNLTRDNIFPLCQQQLSMRNIKKHSDWCPNKSVCTATLINLEIFRGVCSSKSYTAQLVLHCYRQVEDRWPAIYADNKIVPLQSIVHQNNRLKRKTGCWLQADTHWMKCGTSHNTDWYLTLYSRIRGT